MIVKRYRDKPRLPNARERAGAAAEKQMAHYLHRKFHGDPAVCILHQLRIEDAEQPEHDGSAGVCQIDHLVVHQWGFFLVECKSVTEVVQVRPDGDGGDEWSRTHQGEQKGMPSPIRQARRQADFLRTLLHRHRTELVGRLPFGLRFLPRILGLGDQRGFAGAPMQLVIAVSDGGRICRLDGWKPPEKPFRVLVKKADLVPERIVEELDRHQTGANLLHVRPVGDYGLWRMGAEEVHRVAEFLAGRHRDRTVDSSVPQGDERRPRRQRGFGEIRDRHRNAYERWSPEEDRELVRLREGGWDHARLADRFGRQRTAIKSRLRKLER